MKSSLKTVLAAALIAIAVASCGKKEGENTANDATQAQIDTAAVGVDTTGAEGDTATAQ